MTDNTFFVNENIANPETEYTYFTVIGSHTSMDNDGNPIAMDNNTALAFMKKIENVNEPQFYIKVGLHGKIYNPIGMYSEGKSNKFLSKIGKNEYNFTRVNKKVFDLYLNFLKTKNLAWLNNAEREMI